MVELLSPAGNYEGFLGAIHAGADAVYLAGMKYGARAYADNFTEEEIIQAILYAHLFGRKVYLTVNTLVKEAELQGLYEYLKPLYDAKLDGVIIQDVGVFQWIKRNFPDLELHCSTQMAITGVYGAKCLKEMGASRVVVARELSLDEIENIIHEVDVEIEAFIHGAMCYSYSGNCLFSSMLGGRSGNRGKCAQPCRLPYELEHVSKHAEYLLSLKDMCLLPQLQSVLEAGIHSLKIEGRMKRPEYTAGVTAIYRKYIDRYYENPENKLVIEEVDLEYLSKLYIRSEVSEGYALQHNGANMVTLAEPSYAGIPEEVLGDIQNKYLSGTWKIPVHMEVTVEVGMPIRVTVVGNEGKSISIAGEVVLEAKNQPIDEAAIQKQFKKMGDTNFTVEELRITLVGNCFLPVKSMNEIRREAVQVFQHHLLEAYEHRNVMGQEYRPHSKVERHHELVRTETKNQCLHVSVLTREQLNVAITQPEVSRLFIEVDGLQEPLHELEGLEHVLKNSGKELYVKLPYILRRRSYKQLESLHKILECSAISGVMVRNIESIQWLREIGINKSVVLDSNVYTFNQEAYAYYKEQGYQVMVPYELNQGELRAMSFEGESYYCYGKVPMMISANCVYQTKGQCGKSINEFVMLKDRYNKKLPVYLNCNYCYNVIYNAVPLSLHQSVWMFANKYGLQGTLQFTNETQEEMLAILAFYVHALHTEKVTADAIGIAYTKGHLKRGVE